MTLFQKTFVTASDRRKCGHGWQDCSQLPPETGVGLRIPGTSVPQQPVLHGRQGNSLFRGRGGSCLQCKGAQAKILPRAQRWHNKVIVLTHTQQFENESSVLVPPCVIWYLIAPQGGAGRLKSIPGTGGGFCLRTAGEGMLTSLPSDSFIVYY